MDKKITKELEKEDIQFIEELVSIYGVTVVSEMLERFKNPLPIPCLEKFKL